MRTLEGFEPVFGEARGQLDSATLHPLPFLFYLRAKGSDHLLIHVTDFHANTWCADMSTDYLEDLKEDTGIGGSFDDFVSYVRAVFSSDNVQIVLRGSTIRSASVLGQKAIGQPRIRVYLTKLEGNAASDAMATISVGMSRLYRSQAAFLASESARAVQLATAYAQEKARADMLQEKLDGFNFNKKKRLRPTLSNESLTQATQSIVAAPPVPESVVATPPVPESVVATPPVPESVVATPSVSQSIVATASVSDKPAAAAASSGQMEPPKSKPSPAKTGPPRLRAAPLVRKHKRKINVDSD